MARRAETLEAINDLLASATILALASSDLLAGELEDLVGDRLTFAQLKLLRLVERRDSLSIGDVAVFLGISSAAASKAVDRLVRSGLLQREESKDDRRTLQVSATRAGRDLLTAFQSRSDEALLRLLAGVAPQHLREMSGDLDRLSLSLCSGEEESTRACFRCSLYLRDKCLLRTLTDRRCYLHLGTARRAVARQLKGPGGGESVGVMTRGGG